MLPWAAKLDALGNPVWEVTTTTPVGVANLDVQHASSTSDGGYLFAGTTQESPVNSRDVVLVKLSAASQVEWTLAMDGGEWDDGNMLSDRGSTEFLVNVLGDSSSGWYVIAESDADVELADSGENTRTFINAPSLVVWFVSSDGTIGWQRRILLDGDPELMVRNAGGGTPEFDRKGPRFLSAATSNDFRDLVLLLRNYRITQPGATAAAPGESVIRIRTPDDPREEIAVEHVYTQLGEYDTDSGIIMTLGGLPGAAQEDDGFLLIVGNRYIDTTYTGYDPGLSGNGWVLKFDHDGVTESRLTKLSANGSEEWSWDNPENDIELTAVGRTRVGGQRYYWAGGSTGQGRIDWSRFPDDRDADTTMTIKIDDIDFRADEAWLGRFSEAGELIETCAVPGNNILAMEADGDDLVVLYSQQASDVLREAIYRDTCVPLSARAVFQASDSAFEFFEETTTEWSQMNSVLPTWTRRNDQWFGRIGDRLHSVDGTVSVPNASDSVSRRQIVADENEVVTVIGPNSVASLDEFGLMTEQHASEPGVLPEAVIDDSRRMWTLSENHITLFESNEVVRRFEYSGPRHAVLWAGQFAFQVDASGEGASRFVVVDENLSATARTILVGDLHLIDAFESSLAFRASSQIAYIDTASDNRWLVDFSGTGNSLAGEVSLVDLAIAQDGGVVALLRISDFYGASASLSGQNGDILLNDQDIGLLKIDPTGRPQWLRVYGGATSDLPGKIERTTNGYFVTASSESVDAVSPGTIDIWVLKTGADGHIQGLETGEDLCSACIASISGQELVDAVSINVFPVGPIGSPESYELVEVASPEREVLPIEGETLRSVNTAQQCSGQESNFQEAAIARPGEENFTLAVSILTDGNPAAGTEQGGGRVTSSPVGIDCGLQRDCAEPFPEGTVVELTATPYQGYEFVAWDAFCDGATVDSLANVTMNQTTECQASFARLQEPQALTVTVTGDGTVTTRDSNAIDCRADGGTCTAMLPFASTVILDVTPDAGEEFIQWGGDCAAWGRALSNQLTMDSAYSCTASFSEPTPPPPPQTATVTVSLDLDGQPVSTAGEAGRVLGTGIDCSMPGQDCAETVVVGSSFTLDVLQVAQLVRFSHWTSIDSGSICDSNGSPRLEFTVNEDTACTAEFVTRIGPQAALTATIITDGFVSNQGGRVQSNPAGIDDCGSSVPQCTAEFNSGTAVTLTATPRPGYVFGQWSGDSATPGCAGTTPSVTVSMNGPRQCSAVFLADTASGNSNTLAIAADLPQEDRPRVTDVNAGLVDCVGSCSISLPIDQSPYQLRQTTPPGSIQDWSGCDALVTDPTNASGPPLCEVDISGGDRVINLVPPAGT